MIYEINHTTTYDYSEPVAVSHHLMRLRPRDLPSQKCLTHALKIEPDPAVARAHTDYFGNRATFVTIESAHQQLIVSSRNRVEVGRMPLPAPAESPAWENA